MIITGMNRLTEVEQHWLIQRISQEGLDLQDSKTIDVEQIVILGEHSKAVLRRDNGTFALIKLAPLKEDGEIKKIELADAGACPF